MSLPGFAGGGAGMGGIDTGDIGHSLRFRSAASAYLSRTFGTPTNNKIYTISGWVKNSFTSAVLPTIIAPTGGGFLALGDGVNHGILRFNDGVGCDLITTSTYRDPSSHLHIVVAVDTTQVTAANRVKIYINNVLLTSFSTAGYMAQNAAQNWNSAVVHNIGRRADATNYFDGYLSRICFVDGQALTPSSFGYLNTTINEWVSKSQSEVKAVVDAGGANSFMLDFDDATSLTTLGYDKSSKGNNWTCNNISLTAGVTYDHMLDVPGNSYATLSPINEYGANVDQSYGNLRSTVSSTSAERGALATIAATVPIYFEVTFTTTSADNNGGFGLTKQGLSRPGNSADTCVFLSGGDTRQNSSNTTIGGAPSSGQTYRCAYDPSAGKAWIGGVSGWFSSGDPATATNPMFTGLASGLFPASYHYNTSDTLDFNFGQRPFAYTPPTGFLALCQANLPDPATVTVSGTFTGNASADGPSVWMNGVPKTLTINGNAVTFGTHADKTAGGFKLRTSSSSYNTAGSNTWTATIDSDIENCFKYRNAQGNP